MRLRGTLADLHASWDGDPDHVSNVALRTRFDRLAVAAQPTEPAVDSNGRARPGSPDSKTCPARSTWRPAADR